VWHTGLIGTLQGSGGQQIRDQLIVEAYQAQSNSSWTLHLRNTGNKVVAISAIYVDANPVTFSGVTTYGPGEAGTLTVDVSDLTLECGVGYPVKIVTKDGAVFSFLIIYGRQQ